MQKSFTITFLHLFFSFGISVNAHAFDTVAAPSLLEIWNAALQDAEQDTYNPSDIQAMSRQIYQYTNKATLKPNWLKYKYTKDFGFDQDAYAFQLALFRDHICKHVMQGLYFFEKQRSYYPQKKKKPYVKKQKTMKKTNGYHHCYIRNYSDLTIELYWVGTYWQKTSS